MKKFSLKGLDVRKFAGTIVGGLLFLVCVLYFTYAYYDWRSENTTVNLGIVDANLRTECIPGVDITVNDLGPVLDYRDGAKADFSIKNDNLRKTINLNLNITSITSNLLVEDFKYVVVQDVNGGEEYDYDNPVLSGDFSNIQVGDNEIGSVTIDTGETYTFQFIVYIDGTVENDVSLQDGSMVANIGFGNCDGSRTLTTLADHVINLYNDSDSSFIENVYIGGDTSKPTVTLNETQGIMLDNNGEYRYYGANPKNYVSFNGELWRIISSSNVKSSANDTVGEQRIKLIKATTIGDYAWDSDYVNNWSNASLMCQLNASYAGETIEACTSKTYDDLNVSLNSGAKSLIDDALWYLGGSSEYEGLYADDYYNFERGTEVIDGHAINWIGKVALMYPSDYVYAANLNVCTKDGFNYGIWNQLEPNCAGTDWLYDSNNGWWTIAPNSVESSDAFNVFSSGVVGNEDDVIYSYDIRPVVYLKSDVTIVGGDGTDGNPYRLGSILATDYIEDLYNDGSDITTVNIANNSEKPSVSLNPIQSIMLDNNGDYRYYGANPDNYVKFNGELWRIISSSNVKANESDTEGEQRLKIIRDDYLGYYSWDSSDSTVNNGRGINDWTQADLMTELNTLYYNGESGLCTNGKNNVTTKCDFTKKGFSSASKLLIDNALWSLGGTDGDSGIYASDYYNLERGTLTYNCSTDDGYCPRATSWTGKIAIMYPSDYTYAADLSVCTKDGWSYETDTTNCTGTDWLYKGDVQSLLFNYVKFPYSAYNVRGGGFANRVDAYVTGKIYPTVYLKANVTITGGDGTSDNPYILSIN